MNLGLKKRVILVTGGASGIGEAIVEGLQEEEAIPVVLDLASPPDSSFCPSIPAWFSLDLCDEEALQQSIAEVKKRYGRIDGIVNNAGINDSVGLDGTMDEFRQSLDRNLTQCFSLVRLCADSLRQSSGSIVNIGSKVFQTGQGNTSGYAAAKGGLAALTREWAIDFADDEVRCNAVIPAEVWTPMYEKWISQQDDPDARRAEIESRIPLGERMTQASEIAATVLFLLSEKSSHTTGQILFVDGGYTHLDRAFHA